MLSAKCQESFKLTWKQNDMSTICILFINSKIFQDFNVIFVNYENCNKIENSILYDKRLKIQLNINASNINHLGSWNIVYLN